MVIIYFITSYGSIYPIVRIQLSSFVFYQNNNVRAFIIILDVTMKTVAFEN